MAGVDTSTQSCKVRVTDAATGELVRFGGGSSVRQLEQELERIRQQKQQVCRDARVDLVEIKSGGDVLKPVIDFFAGRRRRMTGTAGR